MLHLSYGMYLELHGVALLCVCKTDTCLTFHLTLSSVSTTPSPETTTLPNSTATPPFSDCPFCLNGGTYVGGYCQCLPGYSGVYCEMAIYSPGTYGNGTGLQAQVMHIENSAACTLPHPLFLFAYSPYSPLSSFTLFPLTLLPHPPSLLYTLA